VNILSTVKGLDNHRGPKFRFCRFFSTGLDFGRPRPGRSWWSLWRWFTASKIKWAIVHPLDSAISDQAAQTSGGWIMFLRIVIVSLVRKKFILLVFASTAPPPDVRLRWRRLVSGPFLNALGLLSVATIPSGAVTRLDAQRLEEVKLVGLVDPQNVHPRKIGCPLLERPPFEFIRAAYANHNRPGSQGFHLLNGHSVLHCNGCVDFAIVDPLDVLTPPL
jgi:hypothetical protein